MHRTSHVVSSLFAAAVLVSGLVACSSHSDAPPGSGSGASCTSDGECPFGQGCVDGVCGGHTDPGTGPIGVGDDAGGGGQSDAGTPPADAGKCINVTCNGACCNAGEECVNGACAVPQQDSGVCHTPGQACTSTSQCCQSGSTSPNGQVCISDDGVCHAKCTSGSQCNSGCCAPVQGQSYGVCASADHCTSTLEKTGEHCTANAQCASNMCAGGNGWCTATCSPTAAACAGGYGSDGLHNKYGNYNWCFKNNGGQDTCFPGCHSNADCAVFPGTTCKSGYDVTGSYVSICSA